ncbi:MAG: hypothetical protein P8R37_07965 [Opitutae bacterium]|nr:hypothetical protein [Opitutae bacterium]MDG1301510.1 hypothetical protein [Opitutae bacterium]
MPAFHAEVVGSIPSTRTIVTHKKASISMLAFLWVDICGGGD